MRAFLALAAVAVLIVLISGCTQPSVDNNEIEPEINIELPQDNTTIDTDLGLGNDLAPADDYSNSMSNDVNNLQDNSEPDSNLGLGEL